jgi:colicin import membrane protein
MTDRDETLAASPVSHDLDATRANGLRRDVAPGGPSIYTMEHGQHGDAAGQRAGNQRRGSSIRQPTLGCVHTGAQMHSPPSPAIFLPLEDGPESYADFRPRCVHIQLTLNGRSRHVRRLRRRESSRVTLRRLWDPHAITKSPSPPPLSVTSSSRRPPTPPVPEEEAYTTHLREEAVRLQAQNVELYRARDALMQDIQDLESQRGAIMSEWADAHMAVEDLRHTHAALQTQLADARAAHQHLAPLQVELADARRELDNTTASLRDSRLNLAAAKQSHADMQVALNGRRNELRDVEAATRTEQSRLASHREELAGLHRSVQEAQKELSDTHGLRKREEDAVRSRITQLRDEAGHLEAQLAAAKRSFEEDVIAQRHALRQVTEAVEAEHRTLAQVQSQVATTNGSLASVDKELVASQSRHKRQEDEFAARQARLERDLKEVEARLVAAKEARAQADTAADHHRAEARKAVGDAQTEQRRLAQLREQLGTVSASLKRAEAELGASAARHQQQEDDSRRRLVDARKDADVVDAQNKARSAELRRTEEGIQAARLQLHEIQDKVATEGRALKHVESDLNAATARHERLESEARARLSELRKELEAADTQLKARLASLRESHADVDRILEAKQADARRAEEATRREEERLQDLQMRTNITQQSLQQAETDLSRRQAQEKGYQQKLSTLKDSVAKAEAESKQHLAAIHGRRTEAETALHSVEESLVAHRRELASSQRSLDQIQVDVTASTKRYEGEEADRRRRLDDLRSDIELAADQYKVMHAHHVAPDLLTDKYLGQAG